MSWVKLPLKTHLPPRSPGAPGVLVSQAFPRPWCRQELAAVLAFPSLDPWASMSPLSFAVWHSVIILPPAVATGFARPFSLCTHVGVSVRMYVLECVSLFFHKPSLTLIQLSEFCLHTAEYFHTGIWNERWGGGRKENIGHRYTSLKRFLPDHLVFVQVKAESQISLDIWSPYYESFHSCRRSGHFILLGCSVMSCVTDTVFWEVGSTSCLFKWCQETQEHRISKPEAGKFEDKNTNMKFLFSKVHRKLHLLISSNSKMADLFLKQETPAYYQLLQ